MTNDSTVLATVVPSLRDVSEATEEGRIAGAEQQWQRIHIEGLIIECLVGIHEHEKRTPQRIRIDVALTRREPAVPTEDDYQRVMCYETLIDKIRAMVTAGHTKLIETLIERIADICLADYPELSSMSVKVGKLDVFSDVSVVSAELERHFAQGAS